LRAKGKEKKGEEEPRMSEGEALKRRDLGRNTSLQNNKKGREASLVKRMEELEGLPSTYASILQVLKDRGGWRGKRGGKREWSRSLENGAARSCRY